MGIGIVSQKPENGYCFIRSSKNERIFVHINNVDRSIFEQLSIGTKVYFEYMNTKKGKSAVKIRLLQSTVPQGITIDFSEQQIRGLFPICLKSWSSLIT